MDSVLKPATQPITNEDWLKKLGWGWRESVTGGEAKEIIANCEHRIEGHKIMIELERIPNEAP